MSDANNLGKIEFNFKIWLSSKEGKGIMGDGKWKILKAIEKHGSLKAATEALGITYRRTWGDLKKIENDLGIKLLEKSRGGKDGGTTVLTPEGQNLVNAFDTFHNKVDQFIEQAFVEFRQNIIED
ncbi:MAG: hypothetical protein B6D61_07740 [Bacteroidetes bacterium 4484_249]|nr:MAG: hypothetical protein B6D61_07740 [Bacteroidetes bacterium 4484_249]